MAKTANLNIRIDPEVRKEAEDIYGEWGLTISDAITAFLMQSIKVKGFPFDLRQKEADDPFWSETNQKILRESIAQLERDGGTVHELIEVDDE